MFLNTIFKDRQFTSLFWTQFLGALNDNFFKNALVVMITFRGVQIGGIGTSSLVALAGAIFIFPFFLFSPLAGQLSDKFEKSKIVRYTKIWEVLIMLLGVAGFLWESFPLLLAVLFLMGVHSTFFGPVKYSILPQIVPAGKLMLANAYVELGTFLAILIGTIAGGLAASSVHATTINSVGIILFALLGLIAAWRLGPVTRGNPDLYVRYNPIPTFREMWSLLREKTAIFNSVLGISWFWFFGAGILSVLPIYCKDYLGADESVVTAFLTMFTLGIGAGSILCERLSHGRVEIGLVPFGSLGMTVFMVDLFFVIPSWLGTLEAPMTFSQFVQTPEGLRLLGDFLLTSLFGGFFIVPLYALIQERSHSASRSRVIAANNVMNAFFMVVSSALVMTFYQAGLTLPQMFLVFAALNAIVAVYIYTVVPEFTLRFLSWILANLLYRTRVRGLDRVPAEGGVVLTCNHVSYIDWMIIMAGIKRPARFIMYYKFFEIPILRYLMRHAGVIPIAGRNENEAIFQSAFDQVSHDLREGQVVCIFPEGRITSDGELAALKPGILRIVERDPVPVVPMAINNLWGSLFSRKDGSAFFKLPRKFWRTIELHIGTPIPAPELTLERLHEEIQRLRRPGTEIKISEPHQNGS